MRRQAIIEALEAGGTLVKYKDRFWSMNDHGGNLLSNRFINSQTACSIIRQWPGGMHYTKRGEYEEWRQKAKMHRPDAPTKPAYSAGVCRFCGCTEAFACYLPDQERPCAWADATQTFCDHPKCLAAARAGG